MGQSKAPQYCFINIQFLPVIYKANKCAGWYFELDFYKNRTVN